MGRQALADLSAFFLWHPGFAQWTFGEDPADPKTVDEVLDDITLYWLRFDLADSADIDTVLAPPPEGLRESRPASVCLRA